MLLRAKNIAKAYQQDNSHLPILTDVNFTLSAGQRVAIMGPSGSGKSTLLSILACLDRPDYGELFIAEQNVSKLSLFELNQFRAKHIGIIFQNFHLLPRLTAAENIRLPLDFLGKENPEQLVNEILSELNLKQRANHYPNQLSRGECQRIAIARVLVTQPKIVFADEPTGSLDVRTANQIMDLLNQHLPKTCGFVMVTHDPRMAQLCQSVYRLENGQLLSGDVKSGTYLGI